MARIRSLKPEALQHRKVGPLSDRAFRIWLALLTQADDEGRVIAEASQVRVWAFAYHPDVTVDAVEQGIQEVAKPGLIRLYSDNDMTRYACFPSWNDHQRINRPTSSKLPEPPRLTNHSMNAHGILSEPSVSTHAGSDQDRIGGDRKGSDRREGECRGEPDAGHSALAAPSAAASCPASIEAGSAGELKSALNEETGDKHQLAMLRALRVNMEPGEWLAHVRKRKYPEALIQRVLSENGKVNGRCQGVSKSGECQLPALAGTGYCRHHQGQAG